VFTRNQRSARGWYCPTTSLQAQQEQQQEQQEQQQAQQMGTSGKGWVIAATLK
jgi:hypothetical protein